MRNTPKTPQGKFPKSSRLLKHADFQAVYQRGRKQFSGNMAVFFRERDDQAGPRIGFAVGKVLGGAVQRNRIRRRMRSAVQRRLSELARPVDVVLHPRKAVLEMDFSRLEQEIRQLFVAIEKGKSR
ncbi:MAG TPA: ribonuclease P protein component [Candidatus Angelobacter sp.]|nr:ribonuclease P protein component [Candidatus Angelobacter sp.]